MAVVAVAVSVFVAVAVGGHRETRETIKLRVKNNR